MGTTALGTDALLANDAGEVDIGGDVLAGLGDSEWIVAGLIPDWATAKEDLEAFDLILASGISSSLSLS